MTFEKLQEILSEYLEIEKDDITLDSNLNDDLGTDSIDLIDLAMSVEDEFHLELPEELLEEVQTVGDIVKYIDDNI